MPDTKIHKTPNGWIDDDEPTVYYAVRRLARDARRKNHPRTIKSPKLNQPHVTVTVTNDGGTVFTSLQHKLYNRLTLQQGLDKDEAEGVILRRGYGYNKAASYGHMRAAGATELEATIVLSLSHPGVSKSYGELRAKGESHVHALTEAVNVNKVPTVLTLDDD